MTWLDFCLLQRFSYPLTQFLLSLLSFVLYYVLTIKRTCLDSKTHLRAESLLDSKTHLLSAKDST
jgi:hypothetical protein